MSAVWSSSCIILACRLSLECSRSLRAPSSSDKCFFVRTSSSLSEGASSKTGVRTVSERRNDRPVAYKDGLPWSPLRRCRPLLPVFVNRILVSSDPNFGSRPTNLRGPTRSPSDFCFSIRWSKGLAWTLPHKTWLIMFFFGQKKPATSRCEGSEVISSGSWPKR
jgi:hypothetical protein